MRIAAIQDGSELRFGVVDGGAISISRRASWAGEVEHETTDSDRRPLDAGVGLAAPIVPVRNLFCVGWNYVEHFEEGRAGGSRPPEIPALPTYFTKATTAVIGPFDPIEAHAEVTETLDWEVELAVVIGRGGRDIRAEDALRHVLGVMVANDVSARNVQRGHGGQWFRGKSLDGTCPIGPWIVTLDEFGDFAGKRIRCRVNGEVVQDATLDDMHFDVPTVIAELSRGLTLLAGDVILTGTPPGVGFAQTPPRYLSTGDVVESEIEGIGTLRNTVVDHTAKR